MRTLTLVLVIGFGTAAAAGSQRKTFDVASVKPARAANYSYSYLPGGGFRGTLPVEWLIGLAYEIQPLERIVGEPSWVKSQFFEIDARSNREVSRTDTLAMLRSLLEERFGLAWKKTRGEKTKVYALTMIRSDGRLGPGIRRALADCVKSAASRRPSISERQLHAGRPVPCGIAGDGLGLVAGGNEPLASILLPMKLAVGGEEVIDRTGLSGSFDYYVHLPRNSDAVEQDAANATLFSAVQEQLGMKLERVEMSWDLFVIERISQPSPN